MAEEKLAEEQQAIEGRSPLLSLPAEAWLNILFFLRESDCSNLYQALIGLHASPLVLKRSYGVHNFFQPPTSVTSTLIPLKSPEDDEELETTYVTQLRNKQLLCCYADGNLALYSPGRAENVSNSGQFLPPGKTIDVHELTDGRLIICQVIDDEAEGKQYFHFLVDIQANTSKELDLLDLAIKCISSIDSERILIGTTNGRLIQFDLEANKILKLWPLAVSTRGKRVSKQPLFTEESDLQVLSETVASKGRSILCIDQNCSGGIFVVLDFENGYLSGLFDPEESEFRRLQFYNYPDFNKIGCAIARVIYDRYGKLTFIAQYEGRSSPHVCEIDKNQVQLKSIHPQKTSGQSGAFVFPNGNMSFLSYHYPHLNQRTIFEDSQCHSDSEKVKYEDFSGENEMNLNHIDLSLYTDLGQDNDEADSEDPKPEHGLIEIQSFRIA